MKKANADAEEAHNDAKAADAESEKPAEPATKSDKD